MRWFPLAASLHFGETSGTVTVFHNTARQEITEAQERFPPLVE